MGGKTLDQAMADVRAAWRDVGDAILDTWMGQQMLRFIEWLNHKLK